MAETKVVAELTHGDQAVGFTIEDLRLLLAQVTGEQLLEVLPDHPDLRLLAMTNVPISADGETFASPLIVLERGMSEPQRANLFALLAGKLPSSVHDGSLPGTTIMVTRSD